MSAPLNALNPARLNGLRVWLESLEVGEYSVFVLPPGSGEDDAILTLSSVLDGCDNLNVDRDTMSMSSTCGALDIQTAGRRFYFYAGLESSW